MSSQAYSLIATDYRSVPSLLRRLSGSAFSWAFLGQRVDQYNRVKNSIRGEGTFLDTNDLFQQAAEELREPYLALQWRIGQELNSLRWWITTLSYRSGYVSNTFHRACYLKVALHLLRSWAGPGALLVVADGPVRRALVRNLGREAGKRVKVIGPGMSSPMQPARDTINMLAHRAAFVVREGYRILQARRIVPEAYVPAQPTTLIMSSVSFRNLHMGHDFQKLFFGDLAEQFTVQIRQLSATGV